MVTEVQHIFKETSRVRHFHQDFSSPHVLRKWRAQQNILLQTEFYKTLKQVIRMLKKVGFFLTLLRYAWTLPLDLGKDIFISRKKSRVCYSFISICFSSDTSLCSFGDNFLGHLQSAPAWPLGFCHAFPADHIVLMFMVMYFSSVQWFLIIDLCWLIEK